MGNDNGNDDNGNLAGALCTVMGIFCNMWSSPTGLFTLTYTNNMGLPSYSYVVSESLWNQDLTDPNFSYADHLNTKDLYICTGTYDSTTDSLIPANGGCDLTKKSVNSGETYYFITSSTSYTWSISYPLSDGAVAGIVIGVLVFLGCCCGGIAFVIMKNKKKNGTASNHSYSDGARSRQSTKSNGNHYQCCLVTL